MMQRIIARTGKDRSVTAATYAPRYAATNWVRRQRVKSERRISGECCTRSLRLTTPSRRLAWRSYIDSSVPMITRRWRALIEHKMSAV